MILVQNREKIKHFYRSRGRLFLQILLSYLGTWGICYLAELMGTEHASFGILNLMLMPALFFLLSKTAANLNGLRNSDRTRYRKRIRYTLILSFLFSVSMIMGYQLQTNGMTECGIKGKGLILLHSAYLSIAVFPFANLLFQGLEKWAETDFTSSASSPSGSRKTGRVFLICACIIFVCLIPVWLAYYPIIMSYDFHHQINEAVKGFLWFVQYQPLAHTWLIWLFLQLGYLLGSLETGMACMALFHMLVYSLVTAYACVFIYRILHKKWCVILAAAFFCLFPLNTVMVVCTTKDVLFSCLFLLFFLLMAERSFFCSGKRKLLMDGLLILAGCIMIQFRSNAIHAVIVFSILWILLTPGKEKLRILLLCSLLIAGSQGTAFAVKAALGTNLGISGAEMFSVPIQQFMRVGYYHGNELDDETKEMLNSYVPEYLWQEYYPPLSDNAKSNVAVTTFDTAWEGHMLQVFSDWFRLGMRYPNEYIDAFLELTRGYWFPDDRSYAECLGYGLEGRMGIIYTYNSSATDDFEEIRHESKFPWLEEQLEKTVSGNSFYHWPVISVLFKSAFYFWGLLLLFLSYLYLGRKPQIRLCLFPLSYMATMLLGPVALIRYLFPVMVLAPLLTALLFLGKET